MSEGQGTLRLINIIKTGKLELILDITVRSQGKENINRQGEVQR